MERRLSVYTELRVYLGGGIPPLLHKIDREGTRNEVCGFCDHDARVVDGGSVEVYLGLVDVKAGAVLLNLEGL